MLDILVVCTANQARSPAAAQLLADQAVRLGRKRDVRVTSAGVNAQEGVGILPTMATAMKGRGMDIDSHRSRQVNVDEVLTASLTITMTEEQRRTLSRIGPWMISRCFTLRELDRLICSRHWRREWNGADDVIARMHSLRPLVVPATEPEDITDPMTGGKRLAQSVLGEIDDLVTRISPALFDRPVG